LFQVVFLKKKFKGKKQTNKENNTTSVMGTGKTPKNEMGRLVFILCFCIHFTMNENLTESYLS